MNLGLITAISISLAALLAIFYVINSATTNSMQISDIQVSEHADPIYYSNITEGPPNVAQIQTIGYWNKETITVAFFASDLNASDSQTILAHAKKADHSVNSNSTNYIQWANILQSIGRTSNHIPQLKVIEKDRDNADVKVVLLAKQPQSGKAAITMISRHSQTNQLFHAEIDIYAAKELYEKGLLQPVLSHELGHAIGLGHSNSQASIMYPRLTVVDGKLIGTIGDCEAKVVSMLYTEKRLTDVTCTAR